MIAAPDIAAEQDSRPLIIDLPGPAEAKAEAPKAEGLSGPSDSQREEIRSILRLDEGHAVLAFSFGARRIGTRRPQGHRRGRQTGHRLQDFSSMQVLSPGRERAENGVRAGLDRLRGT